MTVPSLLAHRDTVAVAEQIVAHLAGTVGVVIGPRIPGQVLGIVQRILVDVEPPALGHPGLLPEQEAAHRFTGDVALDEPRLGQIQQRRVGAGQEPLQRRCGERSRRLDDVGFDVVEGVGGQGEPVLRPCSFGPAGELDGIGGDGTGEVVAVDGVARFAPQHEL